MSQRDRDARAAMPMLLWCPECGARHVDGGEFATKLHHTHACQECGHVWRPAIEPTCGVRFLPGFKNADAEAPEMPEPAPVRDDERAKVKEACEEARREGRDAGMREARGRLRAMADENAKLRAVAEAAARLQRWRETDHGRNSEGVAVTSRLIGALDAALPNWRTAP